MKRSQINAVLEWAKRIFDEHNFKLPPFAFWTPEDWQLKGRECDEIRRNMLGWDITDFGSGDLERIGMLLFTLRNGNLTVPEDRKNYAEKIMILKENQECPLHFHWQKMEDIINRNGGTLCMRLYNSTEEGGVDEKSPVTVCCDGVKKTVSAGAELRLAPGESITLPQRMYHVFYGQEGGGPVLIGEVSAVNDDTKDNCFAEPSGRFLEIEEDENPLHYLCNEYPAVDKE